MRNPDSIGPFKVEAVLGKGGMGTVYLGRDEQLHRPVAIKLLSDTDHADLPERYLNEARAAAAVRHSNVATIYQVGRTEDGTPFIAMEYCPGQTLSELIRRQKIDAGRLVKLAIQVASGLAAAHDNGIIHRDVKSSNIIVEANDVVKILDFGLARPFDAREQGATGSDASTVGRFFGTLPYLSPEQAEGRPSGTRSDLFSMGIVFYEMATGRLPFNSDNPLELLTKIRSEEPEPFDPIDPHTPVEVTRIISRLLQKNADYRYQSAEAVVVELQEVLKKYSFGEPFGGTRPVGTRTVRLPRTVKRPWEKPLIGLAIIAILAVVLTLSLRDRTDRQLPQAPVSAKLAPIRSIAVLPFKNVDQSESNAFLSIGLADALVTRLQQIRDLNVRPTSSIVQYHDTDVSIGEISKALTVDGVLEGSFIASGNMVRINLQLTDARSGYGVWADQVDGPRDNLIELLDSVSAATARNLERELMVGAPSGRSKPQTTSPQAFEEYLRARALSGSLLPEDHDALIGALEKAIELDPDFAAAHAEMSIALSLGSVRGLDHDDTHDAIWYARQAVRLDPNLAEAHLALGRALNRMPDRFREGMRENLAALRLNPNSPDALFTIISYFVATGDLQYAACAEDRFVAVDPASNDARTIGYWRLNAVDVEGALSVAHAALEAEETRLSGLDIEASAFLYRGDLEAAEKRRKEIEAIAPDHYIGKSLKAMLAAAKGDRAEMDRAIESFRDDAETIHWAALRVAASYAKIGDRDKAIEWLERASDLGNHSWYLLVKHPWFAALQNDPGVQAKVQQIRAELDDVRDDVIGVFQLICPDNN